jgi:hypothetical protein
LRRHFLRLLGGQPGAGSHAADAPLSSSLIDVSRFRINHPINQSIYVIAGHDHMLGYFAELHREGRDRPIKSLDMFTLGRSVSLQDCFEWLIEHGVIDRLDLEAALIAMQEGTRARSKRVRRVVEIVETFKSAAD